MTVSFGHDVLVFAPRGRDALLSAQLLARHDLRAVTCVSIDDLIARSPATCMRLRRSESSLAEL